MSKLAQVGHNNPPNIVTGEVSGDKLKAYVKRIEAAEEVRRDAATFVSGIYAEAKASGFDAKIIRRVVKDRRMEESKRREQEALLELYKSAIGME